MRYPIVILTGALLAVSAKGPKRTVTDAEVRRVHTSAILIDTHNDCPMRTIDGFDIRPRSRDGHTDLPRLKEGGVTGQIFAAYVAATFANGNHSANRALGMIDTIKYDIVAKSPNDFVFATTADEIVAAKKNGKIAALIGIEGGHAIEDSVRLLRRFFELGVRYMTLTHTNTNGFADSSGDQDDPKVKRWGGLNDLGRGVVKEMNRLGMMVDIAHVSDETFWDVLEVSKVPVFSSHSSSRKLCNAARNMTDEMIIAMAKKGGLININFSCDFLSQKSLDASPTRDPVMRKKVTELMSAVTDPQKRAAEMKKLMAGRPAGPRATLADVVAHINHVVTIAGVDHVGLGSDYDGINCAPEGLDDVSKWPNLTRALLEEGYTAEEVHKILGGNMLRFMRAVEKGKSL